MKLILFCSVFVLCGLNVWEVYSQTGAVEEFFWKDYTGLIPSEALPGGIDKTGNKTYIAQLSIVAEYNYQSSNIHTLPATLLRGARSAEAAYRARTVYSNETTNTKILCSKIPSKYRWYASTAQFPTNCRYVVVGLEDRVPLYVGRATVGTEILTGKVLSAAGRNPDLIIPYRGGEITRKVYNVLTYCV